MDEDSELPGHVADSVQSILQLRAEHLQRTGRIQELMNRTVAAVGRPRSLGVLFAVVLVWALGNVGAGMVYHNAWDPPPFSLLQTCLSLVALGMTILILATQRHDDEMALHREQLTLQLAVLSERKSAKIIQLLEELRRDSPHLENRDDHEAAALAKPADPRSVLEAINDEARLAAAAPEEG